MCQPGTTLVLVREKTAYSLLFPQRSGPLSPGLAALAWPSSPTPPHPRLLPQLPLPHPVPPPLKSLAVLWSGATPPLTRGGGPAREGLSYPRVPVVRSPLSLCSYGSVTIEQSHMGAPLHCMLNPQWSHRGSQRAHRQDCRFFGGAQEEGFRL